MKILVEGHLIDTTEITSIKDVEHGKRHFLNRQAGFFIHFESKPSIEISERIPYDSYPSEISRIKKKYSELQEKLTAHWNTDKLDVITLNLK